MADPARPTTGQQACIACFVDLARFTTISEALGRDGSLGTERLVNLINRFFTPAIQRALTLDGDVVGFGGDALTVTFPEHALGEAVAWATEVLTIVDDLEAVDTAIGPFALEAKIGIGDGFQVTRLLSADGEETATNQSWVIGGTAINRAVAAESDVRPGEVGILADVDALPAPSVERNGIRVLTNVEASKPDRPPPAVAAGPLTIDDELLHPFVHDRVIERLTEAGPELLDEHRPITVAFIQINGRAVYEDADVAGHLETAIGIVSRFRGTTISVGSGDKGTTLLAAFGAPVAFNGQRSAAIFTAYALTAAVPCTVGVASGLCFSGRVGAADRWSYTLMGDVVNTASRLMTTAPPGDVLVDEATYVAANSALQFRAPTELRLRGKDNPVRVAFLDAITTESGDGMDLPLAGRSDVVARFQELLDETRADNTGRGSVIVGESGLGKSRLLRKLADLAHRSGFAVARVGLSHRDAATSHGPWRTALFEVLDLSTEAGPGEFEAAAKARLQDRDELATLAREIMFGRTDQIDALAGLEPQAMADIVDTTLAALILAKTDQPLLLVVDDTHDLDEASARLLNMVAKQLQQTPVVLVAVAYPDSEIAAWDEMAPIRLGELSDAEALELVTDHERKSSLALSNEQLGEIVGQVGGNPQLLRLLADYVAGGGEGTLPNDARSIVLARFDRLPVRTQTSLAMAAALGRHFTRDDFVGSFGPDPTGLDLLDDLSEQRLVELTARDEFSFASPILWQVAYESSAHASRARSHRSIGRYIERLPNTRTETRVEDLAHHFGFTDDVARHQRYFGPAGRRAQQAFANQRAISWFERAIEVAADADRPDLKFQLSATFEHIGRWDRAADMLRESAAEPTVRPKALASLAQLQLLTDGYDRAVATLDDALAAAAILEDDATSDWLYEKASIIHTHGGRYEEAAVAAEQQRSIAERLGDQTRVAAALSNAGAAKSWIGDLGGARRELTQALDKLLANGALAMVAGVEVDLAMVALDEGAVDECIDRLQRARDGAAKIGYRRVEAAAAGNLSLALIGEARHAEARDHCVFSCGLLLQSGDIASAAASFGVLALIMLADERPEAAIGLITRTVWIGRLTGSSVYRDRAYGLLTDAYEAMGNEPEADRCRTQLASDESDLSDDEVSMVAPLTPPGALQVERDLAELLTAADALIDQRDRNGESTAGGASGTHNA